MSFSFSFTAKDLDDDDGLVEDSITPPSSKSPDVHSKPTEETNVLDSPRLLQDGILQPKLEDLVDMLHSLWDVRVSFEEFNAVGGQQTGDVVLYKRSLFDIEHQLMSENDFVQSEDGELDILMKEDIRKSVYEGGLKPWECSTDLIIQLHSMITSGELAIQDLGCVIEIGCGTAFPAEYIFAEYIKSGSKDGLRIILTDYNHTALRLASVPNMLITWARLALSKEELETLQPDIPVLNSDEEIIFTGDLLKRFYKDMEARNVIINLVSGCWGRKFLDIVHDLIRENPGSRNMLVLTSETIYQPENLPVVAEILLDLKNSPSYSQRTLSMVAAKDIYFGVGGSIVEFERYLKSKNTDFRTIKVSSGLKRSIVLI